MNAAIVGLLVLGGLFLPAGVIFRISNAIGKWSIEKPRENERNAHAYEKEVRIMGPIYLVVGGVALLAGLLLLVVRVLVK